MFKGLGNIASIMKQAQNMGGRMQAINDELRGKRVSGNAGGGMVIVEVNGLGEAIKVTIEPTLVEKGETEMIEDLLPAAFNQAVAKANQLRVEAMQSLTDGMDLPGLGDALAKFTGMDDSPPQMP